MEFKVGQLVKFREEIFPVIGVKDTTTTILFGESGKFGFNIKADSTFLERFGIDSKYVGKYVCRFGEDYLAINQLTLFIKKRCQLCTNINFK